MWRRARQLLTLSRREWRELLLACAWQLRLRIVLLGNRGAVERLASIAGRRRPVVSAQLCSAEIERLVRWSGVICRGSCLTTAFGSRIIAARHGLVRSVTIGVALDGHVLRAHAWAGNEEGARTFASVWTEGRGTRP